MHDSDEEDGRYSSVQPAEEEESLLSEKCSDREISRKEHSSGHTKYPKSVFLILGTEFCERFNYYGMKTILVIYLTEWLDLAYHRAVALFHMFSMLAYFSPLLGAIIADGYLGRFRTIFYISIVYAIGTLVIALTALPPPELYGPVIGLLLVSLGTGGIKPCVTAFGGDQFSSHQENERMAFFSAFYFMINLGSMLSTFLTPILRVIFVSGRKYYKQVPPTGNLFGSVVRCVGHGLRMRITLGKYNGKDSHWLNYSEGKFEEHFVEDVKALLKVLWLFLPLPLFWALYDQQGSRWTLQAVEMNGNVGSLGRMKPDQLQVINPLLILLLIPIFEHLVYPGLRKLHIPNRPLQRMCVGMALCAAAFVVAGFVQLKIDYLKEPPLQDESGMTFINTVNCSVRIQSSFYNSSLPAFQASPLVRTGAGSRSVSFVCEQPGNSTLRTASLQLMKNQAYRVVIHDGVLHTELSASLYRDRRKKDSDGKAAVSIISLLDVPSNTTVWLLPGKNKKVQETGSLAVTLDHTGASNFTAVEPGQYQLWLSSADSSPSNMTPSINVSLIPVEPVLEFSSGSVQTIVLTRMHLHSQVSALDFISLKENELSMAWLIPQYFVITVGEILFSITGLSFAYSQAPTSMKSVLQAAWHLCVAVGDLVVIIVAETQLMPSQSAEFFMFAAIMGLDTLLFVFMAHLYKSRAATVDSDAATDTTGLVNLHSDNGDDVFLQGSPSDKRK
ncbi:hypothetical protein BsWGS_25190 [Bradybaena similaris]